MKSLLISGACAGILVVGISCSKNVGQPGQTITPNKPFAIFNAMHYQDMPDLTGRGIRNFTLIYENSLFTSNTIETPDSAKIQSLALQSAMQPGVPVSLDIEDWSYSNSQLANTISMYEQVLQVWKQYDTGAVGFYGVVPNDAYSWPNIEPVGSAQYVKWQTLNTALTPIADRVDLFFPSFYTDDNDTASWNQFVVATLSELKKYNVNKPVYAYLWPQYHDGTPNQYQFLDTAVWKYELETLYPLVDGIVIWSSSKIIPGIPSVWDETWAWWNTTEAFISEHQIQ